MAELQSTQMAQSLFLQSLQLPAIFFLAVRPTVIHPDNGQSVVVADLHGVYSGTRVRKSPSCSAQRPKLSGPTQTFPAMVKRQAAVARYAWCKEP